MKPRFNLKNPSALIFAMGSLLPGLAGAQTVLIDAATQNGSFELLGPVPGTVNAAKATDWDTDADGDVTYWTQVPGVTVRGDSGTEVAATTTFGAKQAFMQGGNATYNMTGHVIRAGETYSFAWNSLNTVAHTVSLVYGSDTSLTTLGTPLTSTAVADNTTGTYTVAPGDPAIGKTIGIKFSCSVGYPQFDNVRLSFTYVAPADSDGDGLPDVWETTYFGNLDQGPGDDPDHDGLTNTAELNTTLTNPNKPDTDGDGLSDGDEVNGTSNRFAPGTPTNPLLADSDGDRVSDFEENGSLNIYPLPPAGGGASTNPNGTDTDGDGTNDYEELVYHSDPNDAGSTPEPSLHNLIDNTLRNGDFEMRNGAPNAIKTTAWDMPAPNDIDNWTEWTGVSTVADNTGVEGGGSHGAMRGFFRSGNAAYNMTPSVAAEGSVYSCTWKQVNAAGSTLSVQLVYDDGGVITAIPASLAITNTGTAAVPGIGHLVFRIPAGSPAIGKTIGIGVSSLGNWIGVDEFVLSIADGDSDKDGLGDFYEDEFFGNNDGIPTPTELALQSGTGDFDQDGLSNLDEITLGTLPNDKDTDKDTLSDGDEFTGASNPFGGAPTNPLDPDTDHDGVTDLQEKDGSLNAAFGKASTNPNDPDTDGDGFSDLKELAYASDPNDAASVPTPVVIYLINNQLRNGSFELRNGVPNTIKTAQWDAPAPEDIDNWTNWPGYSVEVNDSGVEAGGTDGAMRGFFQSGNAAYNLTDNIAAEGSVYACTWKHFDHAGIFTVQLVYEDNGAIIPLPDSKAITTGGGQTGDLVYRIPGGSPAIGKRIGIGVTSSGGFLQVDEFALSIAVADTDHDGMADSWELEHFGNLNQLPTGDADGDGTTNLTEFRLGLDPTLGSSRFQVTTSANGVLRWQGAPAVTFNIQRSTTLEPGSWTTLEPAFSGSSYTDPAPPEGSAFYKVGLNP